MEQTTLAYAAGLFDGEGCIQISRKEPRAAKYERHPTYRMTAAITNTDHDIIDWLHETWGGGVSRSGYLRLRQPYRWILCGPSAAAWLTELLPYLKIKREQALIALEYQACVLAHNRGPMTAEVAAERETFMHRLREERAPDADLSSEPTAMARRKEIGGAGHHEGHTRGRARAR